MYMYFAQCFLVKQRLNLVKMNKPGSMESKPLWVQSFIDCKSYRYLKIFFLGTRYTCRNVIVYSFKHNCDMEIQICTFCLQGLFIVGLFTFLQHKQQYEKSLPHTKMEEISSFHHSQCKSDIYISRHILTGVHSLTFYHITNL